MVATQMKLEFILLFADMGTKSLTCTGRLQTQDGYIHRTATNTGRLHTQDGYKHRTATNTGRLQTQDSY